MKDRELAAALRDTYWVPTVHMLPDSHDRWPGGPPNNTRTEFGGHLKAVLMQSGTLATVANCCHAAAAIEYSVAPLDEYRKLQSLLTQAAARIERLAEIEARIDAAIAVYKATGAKTQDAVGLLRAVLEGK